MSKCWMLGLGVFMVSAQAVRADEAPPMGERVGIENEDNAGNDKDAADGYTVIEVPSDGIERYVAPGTDADHIPKTMQGIWWMDGNPTGDILLTMAGSKYDAATRTVQLPVYGPGNYTFYPSSSFKEEYLDLVRTHNRFDVQFNEDFTFATVTAVEDGGSEEAKNEVFTMYLVSDGHWVRESWYYGIKVADYQLRRVVRADGKREAAYTNYLLVAKPTSMIGYKYK